MLTLVNSCQQQAVEQQLDTFQIIQNQILDKSCATSGCHASPNDGSFKQHGLVLEKSVAFANLVNALPMNNNAKKDGLWRVKPFKADESLLFHKLQQTPSAHHSSDYGTPMPLGLPPLRNGQIEFISRWIEAGAPERGSVVDEAVLKDTSITYPKFEALVPPALGQGLQMACLLLRSLRSLKESFFITKQ